MARLRVFVSSTYYDLKHVRSSLEIMVEGMGYDAVLFERGDVSYHPDLPLDESCYSEITSSDIVILIIGGRYGHESSGSTTKPNQAEVEKHLANFDSITRREHNKARDKGIPIYTFVEKSVLAEYRTYQKNKKNSTIVYAHVDSTGVFQFIEQIEQLSRGNAIFPFERFSEIESILKDQWSGLFRDLLRHRGEKDEFSALAKQVEALSNVSQTIETYMETVLKKLEPDLAGTIISQENDRRSLQEKLDIAYQNDAFNYLIRRKEIDPTEFLKLLQESDTYARLSSRLAERIVDSAILKSDLLAADIADLRKALTGSPFSDIQEWHSGDSLLFDRERGVTIGKSPRVGRAGGKGQIAKEGGQRSEEEPGLSSGD